MTSRPPHTLSADISAENIVVRAGARAIDIPLARKWAQWALMNGDLEHVRNAARKAAELSRAEIASPGSTDESGADGDVIAIALRSSAVVAYARCFGGSTRAMLDVRQLKLNVDDREWHDHYIALRNRHVAHAEGVREGAVACAHLSAEGELESLSMMMLTVHGSVDAMDALVRLATASLEHVRVQSKEIEEKLANHVFTIPALTRLTWPEASTTVAAAAKGRPPQLPPSSKSGGRTRSRR